MSHTDPARPSRRAMFALVAGAAAVPALAAPALAIADHPLPATVADATVVPPPNQGPTAIDRLWSKREALHAELKELEKTRRKLKREFEHQLPPPHPSIVYSPENDRDGLKWDRTDKDPFGFIWPHVIQTKLDSVEYGTEILTYGTTVP